MALCRFFNQTGGRAWLRRSGWCSDATLDLWFGLTCAYGYVDSVSLPNNNVVGNLSALALLGPLSELTSLNFSANVGLSGGIPSLAALTSLKYLNLDNTRVSGSMQSVHNALSGSQSLTELHLYNGHLTGVIPSFFLFDVPLRVLSLYNNGIQGGITTATFWFLPLQWLDLSSNHLTGAFPDDATWAAGIQYLNIASNQFTSLPPLTTFPSLVSIDASSNPLTRPLLIPTILPQLTSFTLRNIPQTVTMTMSAFQNAPSLSFLDLSYTRVGGQLQDALVYPSQLRTLRLVSCGVSGFLPSTLQQLPHIVELNLRGSNLQGLFQNWTSSTLKILDLSFCPSIYGPMPLLNMPNLLQLLLLSTSISGPLDASTFAQLQALQVLDISNSRFITGAPPHFLPGSLTNLTTLTIQGTGMNGTVPPFNTLPNLKHLTISGSFHGRIPPFRQHPGMLSLAVAGPYFSGYIPAFGHFYNLRSLSISGSGLEGRIPLFRNLFNLTTLAIEGARLNGSIPDFHLPLLIDLTITGDGLTGAIPNFQGCRNLRFLQITGDGLTSSVPDFHYLTQLIEVWIIGRGLRGALPEFNSTSLEILVVVAPFSCPLPMLQNAPNIALFLLERPDWTEMCELPAWHFPRLQYLDAAYSGITGTIPPSLLSAAGFGFIRLENNFLYGPIPPIGNSLQDLDLSINQLDGTVPSGGAGLTSLDLSSNYLSGSVPLFDQCHYLRTLNLAFNNLVGTVPMFPLPNLQTVNLDHNQLTGHLAFSPNATSLVSFSAAGNLLSGPLPSLFDTALQTLTLNDNLFSGFLPEWPSNDTLASIDLSGNTRLTGPLILPDAVQSASFVSTSVNGSLPDSISPFLLVDCCSFHHAYSNFCACCSCFEWKKRK